MTAPSMAAVLAKHDDPAGWMWSDSDQMVYACQCGDHYSAGPIDVIQQADCTNAAEWHRAHVAQALTDAGFGHVASVEAERDNALADAQLIFGKAMEFKRKRIEAIQRAEAAEARLAAARALADEWSTTDGPVDGSCRTGEHSYSCGRLLREALDGEGGR